jgi:hypothetical protein
MKTRTIWLPLIMLSLAAAAAAQPADAVSGKWGSDGATFLDLHSDGKGGVGGTVFWRADGQSTRAPVRKGSYDPITRTLRLQGDAARPDGTIAPYTIEGRLDGDAISGKVSVGDYNGTFAFSRLKPAGTGRTAEQQDASFEAHKKDFDYLLGDWEFTAENKQYGKLYGYWSAVRLDEGQILDEYRIVGDKGETYYVTTTLRNYNKLMDQWELIGTGAGLGLRDFGTGRKVGDEIHIEQKFGVGTDTPSVWKIRYYNIRPDGFSWTADRSDDDGRTWEKKFQQIEARRIGPTRSLAPLAPARNKS